MTPRQAVSGLREYLLAHAYCPCCATARECYPDCTLNRDAAQQAEDVGRARYAMQALAVLDEPGGERESFGYLDLPEGRYELIRVGDATEE